MDTNHPLYGLLSRLTNGGDGAANPEDGVTVLHMVEIDMDQALRMSITLALAKVLEQQAEVTDILEEMALYLHKHNPGMAEELSIDTVALSRAVRNGYNMQLNLVSNVMATPALDHESSLIRLVAEKVEESATKLTNNLRDRREAFSEKMTA